MGMGESERKMYQDSEFKIGDVVQLKSAGEKMTVDNLPGHGKVQCVWTAGGELHREFFSSDALAKVEGEKAANLSPEQAESVAKLMDEAATAWQGGAQPYQSLDD